MCTNSWPNPGTTGIFHLGSYILKKAETVVFLRNEIEEDKRSNIIVEHKYSRGIQFEDFAFNINEEGLPYLINNWVNTNASNPNI